MISAERSGEVTIANRRLHLDTQVLASSWGNTRPNIQRSVSLAEALHRPPRVCTERGVLTPQGWILSQAVPFNDELSQMSQQQADELMAKTLRWSRARAVLCRHLMNLHPGKNLTRRETVAQALTRLDYFFGDTTEELLELATRIDSLTAEDWRKVSEKLFDLKSQTAQSLLGSPLGLQLTSPLDLTRITEDAFRTAAKYSAEAAHGINPVRADAGYFDPVVNDVFVAAGRAGLEVLHRGELQAQGHKFTYKALFLNGIAKQETARVNATQRLETKRVAPSVSLSVPSNDGVAAEDTQKPVPRIIQELQQPRENLAIVHVKPEVVEAKKLIPPSTEVFSTSTTNPNYVRETTDRSVQMSRRQGLGELAQLVGWPVAVISGGVGFRNLVTMPSEDVLESKKSVTYLGRRIREVELELAKTRAPERRESLEEELELTRADHQKAKDIFIAERREKIEPEQRVKGGWLGITTVIAAVGGGLVYLGRKLEDSFR